MEQFFQSLSNDRLRFKVDHLPSKEGLASRHHIIVNAKNESGETVDLTLSLTIPQLVDIVKHFFWQVTVNNAWAARVLERLLERRWALYTNKDVKDLHLAHRKSSTKLDFIFVDGRRVMIDSDLRYYESALCQSGHCNCSMH